MTPECRPDPAGLGPNDPEPDPNAPEQPLGGFAEGQADPKRYPEDEHIGSLAEGQEDEPHEMHRGSFATGQETEPDPPDPDEGYAEGQA